MSGQESNTGNIMQVVRMHAYGGPEVLQLEELPMPVPEASQALVRVMAAGVNFMDTYSRRVSHPLFSTPLPRSMGIEGAGVVQAVGPGVTHIRAGDRVAWGWGTIQGSYATHLLAPVGELVPLPDSISFEQAAAVITQGMTAHMLSHSVYPLKPGDSCLIQTIAGGVGLLLCQMARMCGAQVIGTTSTPAKAQAAYKAGADAVIIYGEGNIAEEVRRLTKGKGVNVVYDAVGKDTFEANLDSLAIRGWLVLYGQASGPVPPVDVRQLMIKGSLVLTSVTGLHFSQPEEMRQRFHDIFRWMAEGTLRPEIDHVYPLTEVAKAHEALEQRRNIGKVLLIP